MRSHYWSSHIYGGIITPYTSVSAVGQKELTLECYLWSLLSLPDQSVVTIKPTLYANGLPVFNSWRMGLDSCECTALLQTPCSSEGDKEPLPSHHITQFRPLELVQHQLKRVGSNWRRRAAINLPSFPWTCHTASFMCHPPIPLSQKNGAEIASPYWWPDTLVSQQN